MLTWLTLLSALAARPDVAEIVAGQGHTCLLQRGGTVECWGGLEAKALQAGEAPSTLVPTRLTGLEDVDQIAAGGRNRTCAVREREVWCWDVDKPPERVQGVEAVQVSVGSAHTCVLHSSGQVSCWGYNARGQLGDGTRENRDEPVRIAGLHNVAQVTSGFFHTCARHKSGSVSCWGHNGSGQLGITRVTEAETRPMPVPYLEDAIHIEAGSFHTCALRKSGHVVCWGSNKSGQLGDGTRENSTAVAAVHNLDDAISLSVGMDHSCAVRRKGEVVCWGSNEQGQLGNDRFKDHLMATRVPGLQDALSVTAGHQHTCALRKTGQIACWGHNWTGQLGNGTRERSPSPVLVHRER